MSKIKINFVIAFMSVALVGLISLQVYWIKHDITIKEEQFEQNVSMVMQNIVEKFESHRALNYIGSTFFDSDSSTNYSGNGASANITSKLLAQEFENQKNSGDTSRKTRVHSSIKVFKKNNKEIVTFFDNQVIIAPGADAFQKFKDNFDWDQLQSEDLYYYPVDPADENLNIHLKQGRDVNKTVKINADLEQSKSSSYTYNDTANNSKVKVNYSSTTGKNYVISYKTIQRKQDSLMKVFDNILDDDNAQSTILNGREKVEVAMRRYKALIKQMSFELGQADTESAKHEDFKKLDTLIKAELRNHFILLPYKYAVIDVRNDSVIYSSAKIDSQSIASSNMRTQLFPNDIIAKPFVLMIDFPGKLRYVLANVWPILILAALFTLIILLGFTYTIRVIFQQKKLATIKNDFINNMTHEFKTPIATIGLAAESIKNPKVYNDLTKLEFYANIIKQENTRMNDQVTNVLRMAQLDKGELKLQFTEQNLHEIINHVLQNNRLIIADKNGFVHTDLTAKSHLISADLTHLSNSINNLIDNAIKYSNDILDITVKTWNGNEGVYISVADKGIGMSTESYKKIFESFYRATTGNLHDVKGFGLGLSYAKTIIEQHHGTINVKSEKDKGSTFTIYLPFVNEKAAV